MVTGSITITSVTFPSAPPNKPVIEFTLKSSAGTGLTGLTEARFAVAKLIPGASGNSARWQSYINRNATPDGGLVIQATTESAYISGAADPTRGTLVSLGSGNYRYTFANDLSLVSTTSDSNGDGNNEVLDVTYEAGATHRIGIQNGSSTNPSGLTSFKANGYVDVVPNSLLPDGGTASTLLGDTRAIVSKAACNNCHGLLNIHGRRYETGYCVICHNPGSTDAPTGNTVDLKVMVHKIHMGEELPSVRDGGTYKIGSANFSTVVFPRRIADCTACHQGGAQADNWKTVPTQEACGACHDNIQFAAGVGHIAQANNLACAACHGTPDSTKPTTEAHANKVQAAADKFKYVIGSVTNTAPGQNPKVTFQIVDPDGGAPYDLTDPAFTQTASGASTLAILFGWSTSDFNNAGSGAALGQPVSINALADGGVQVEDANTKTYSVTSPTAVPANATGSGIVALQGHPALLAADGGATRLPVTNELKYFAITDTAPKARRAIVDIAKCNNCHGNLSLHGNNRTGKIEVCAICHNPNATDLSRRPTDGGVAPDGKPEETIDLKVMIHAIHSAENSVRGTAKPITVYGRGGPNTFGDVRYPNVLSNCQACHAGTTSWALPIADQVPGTTILSGASRSDQADDLRMTKTGAVCSSCHANPAAKGHMQQNGAVFYGVTQSQIDALK
jgi:OmcA/MtrC family decaheme c-type cytochrome